MMDEIPLKEELVHAAKSLPAEGCKIAIPAELETQVSSLDDGQRNAVDTSLRDRVALIQGPPGTGKSYVGTLLARIFLAATSEQLLVVT